MKNLLQYCVLLFIVCSMGTASHDKKPLGAAVPGTIATSVNLFNSQAKGDPIGKLQPPLTEQEVIAAIRAWTPAKSDRVADEVYDAFQEIAESGWLPEGSQLRYKTKWSGHQGYSFDVWWIDLSIKTGERTGYVFRIRDQKIASHKD